MTFVGVLVPAQQLADLETALGALERLVDVLPESDLPALTDAREALVPFQICPTCHDHFEDCGDAFHEGFHEETA